MQSHALLGVPLAEQLNLRPELRDLLGECLYRGHFDGMCVLRRDQREAKALSATGGGVQSARPSVAATFD